MEFDVIVKIPEGSRNKYEMDHELHRLHLDRMPFTYRVPRRLRLHRPHARRRR